MLKMKTLLCVMVVALAPFASAQEASAPTPALGVEVSEAVVQIPIPGKQNTVAYFTLRNRTDQPRLLVAVSTPVAERAELHRHSEKDGMMSMRQVEEVALPAHGHLSFQPGGYHVMLFDLRRELQTGQEQELVLTFDDDSQLAVTAQVESIFDREHHNH